MEIRMGIAHVAREVSIETEESAESITERLNTAIESGGIFELTDASGRKVLVPAAKVGYVELGSPNARQVGFGAA